MHDEPNYMLANTIFLAKNGLLFSRRPALADFLYVAFCQLVTTIVFSSTRSIATLRDSIINIIFVAAKKEMFRIDAEWVVARMKYASAVVSIAFRYCAKMQFPRQTMGGLDLATYSNFPVAARGCVAYPKPAFIRTAFVDEFPKPFLDRADGSKSDMMTANEAYRLPLDVSEMGTGYFGNWSWLTTTAVAITVRNFKRGIMGLHRNSPFLCQASERLTTLPGRFLLVDYTSNYTTFSRAGITHDVFDGS